jgi:hypothetical protein
MHHAKQQAQANAPFLKTALVLWVLAMCGVFLVLPYVATLENEALTAAAARTHLEVRELLANSVAQTAVLLAIASSKTEEWFHRAFFAKSFRGYLAALACSVLWDNVTASARLCRRLP